MAVDGTYLECSVGAILDCQQTLMLLTIQYWHYFPSEITVDIALQNSKTIVGVTLVNGLKVDANCFNCSFYFTSPLMQLQ